VSLAASFDPGLPKVTASCSHRSPSAGCRRPLWARHQYVRVPQGGRNFEYLGEDPNLASQLVVSEVKGIQAERVAAQVKHFALNDQENDRKTTVRMPTANHAGDLPGAVPSAVQVGGACR